MKTANRQIVSAATLAKLAIPRAKPAHHGPVSTTRQTTVLRFAETATRQPYSRSTGLDRRGSADAQLSHGASGAQSRAHLPLPRSGSSKPTGFYHSFFNFRVFAIVSTVLFFTLTVLMVTAFSIEQGVGWFESWTVVHKLYGAWISGATKASAWCLQKGHECSVF